MQRYKSLVLPIALLGGYFLREFCGVISVIVPYVIFAILVLTFSGVDLKKLRPGKLDFILGFFQVLFSFASYWAVFLFSQNEVLSQGAMICALCPVASSVTVVASMLGANSVRTTTYTIFGNLLVAFVAPFWITILKHSLYRDFLDTFLLVFLKIASVIVLPYLIVLFLQIYIVKVNSLFARYKHFSFYLWAVALFVTIGQTADFVAVRWYSDSSNVVWLGVISLFACFLQFFVGRKIGYWYGDVVAGGQLLGQKNSAMGIWMLTAFLNPVASVAMAFYSIWQNMFNSWQIYRRNKR